MFRLQRHNGSTAIHLWHHHGAYVDHAHAETFCPRRGRIWVLMVAILASSLGFMDRVNIAIAMPVLRADLGSSLFEAQWISNSYLLLMSSLVLVSTAIGERVGLRRLLASGVALFLVGAAGCAAAPTTGWLIGARLLQGIGAAFMAPTSLALVAKAYPREHRGKAIGIWAAASSLLLVVGPLVGGTLITALGPWSWRLLFALNVPLAGASLVILWRKVPDDRDDGGRTIDFVGAALATLALFLVAWALTQNGSGTGAQESIRIVVPLLLGLLALAAFIVRELRAGSPLVPPALFMNRTFTGANVVTFLNDFAISANLFFLPMAIIAGWGESAAAVSILFLPLPICLVLLSEPSGQLADRFGPAPPVALGSIVIAVACAGLALTAPRRNLAGDALILMCVMAFGQSLVVSPLSTAVMTSEDDRDAIVGSGVNNAISRSAWLLSVAAMGTVAAFVFRWTIAGSAADGLGPSFGVAPVDALPGDVDLARRFASDAAYSAIGWITAGMAAFSAIVAAATLGWGRRSPLVAAKPEESPSGENRAL